MSNMSNYNMNKKYLEIKKIEPNQIKIDEFVQMSFSLNSFLLFLKTKILGSVLVLVPKIRIKSFFFSFRNIRIKVVSYLKIIFYLKIPSFIFFQISFKILSYSNNFLRF